MAQFEELSAEQQQAVLQGTLFMRQKAGEFARLANSIQYLLIGAGSDYIDQAVSELDNGALIPLYDPASEFRGATYMSKERYMQLKALAKDIVDLNTDTQQGIKAATVEAVGPFRVIS